MSAAAAATSGSCRVGRGRVVVLLQNGAGIPILLAHLGRAVRAREPVSLRQEAALCLGALGLAFGIPAELGDGLGRADLAGQIGWRAGENLLSMKASILH